MSATAESRSIAYSADTAGRAGRIVCQVVRSHSFDDSRIAYTIVMRNDTTADARVVAYVPDTEDLHHQTIVQSIVGAFSVFSTAVELDLGRYDGIPELRVELSGDDIAFAIVVPSAASPYEDPGSRAAPAALAQSARANGSAHPNAAALALQTLPPRPNAVRPAQTPPIVRTYRAAHTAGVHDLVRASEPRRSPAIVPMFLVFVALLAIVGYAIARPHVQQLLVPVSAPAATRVSIGYAAMGFGTVTYRVIDPAADTIASGSLATGTGTFAVTLPKSPLDRAYLVRVDMNGAFGDSVAQAYVKVAASPERAATVPPAPHRQAVPLPPQIRSLALDRASVAGGDTLNVYYDVAATGGSVALLDAAGQIAYGTAGLSPSGHTAFVVPATAVERFLTVVVTARRGTSTIQSRVAVTATPQAPATPPAPGGGSAPGDTAAVVVPVITVPGSVFAAQPIPVDIRDAVAGLTLVLTDNDGTEVARREIAVAAAQSHTTFTAPKVKTAARYRLTATYAQGDGSETIVKTIDVRPR